MLSSLLWRQWTPLYGCTRIYITSPMLMDIIFQVLTIISNLLSDLFREARVCKKVSLPLISMISVLFYHLTNVVHWVRLPWTLGSCGVQAGGYGGKCTGLDTKDSENTGVSASAWEILEKSPSLSESEFPVCNWGGAGAGVVVWGEGLVRHRRGRHLQITWHFPKY